MNDLSVVIPAYKEKPEFLEETYKHLTGLGAEVIIVDDGNHIDLECPHIWNVVNMGYGYSIKKGIQKATRPYVLTMDADGQHTTEDAEKLYLVFKLIKDCSMLVGTRWNLNEKALRWIGRKAINFLGSLWARHYLVDLNSGMRVFRRSVALGYAPILCDTFSYTTSLTMCMVTDNYKVAYLPIDVRERNAGKSRVKLIRDGIVTVWFIFWIGFALRTRNMREWKRRIAGQLT